MLSANYYDPKKNNKITMALLKLKFKLGKKGGMIYKTFWRNDNLKKPEEQC